MKKITAIFLSVLMLVFAAIPVMASDATQEGEQPAAQPIPRVMPTDVTIDGKMNANNTDEGWAETPYVLLDSTRNNKTTNTKPSKLYLSTDGEYLYAFFQSEKENWAETQDCQLYFYINFSTDTLGTIDLRFNFNKAEVKTGSVSETLFNSVDQKTTDNLPAMYRYNADTSKFPNLDLDFKRDCGTDTTPATLEFKIELSEAEKELLAQGNSDIKISLFEKESFKAGNNGKIASAGFAWGDDLKVTVTLPMVAYLPVFNDVYGKTVTIDGAMDTAEGWSRLPYMILDATTADGATTNGAASSDFSGVRYSADADNLYVYFETASMTSERLYLQFAFDGKTAGADSKGYFLTAELDITPTAENPIVSLTYGDALSYATGDAMYDGVSVAVSQTADRNCVELCVPIPESVAAKRLKDAVTVMLGAYEKTSASAEGGYIPQSGYNATAPNIELVLAKDDASLAEELNKWIEESKTTANHENLTGLSVSVFGDSYFTGGELDSSFTWAAMLAKKYGWTLNNYGTDGNMVSDYDDIDELPMVKRYRQLPNNSPDLVIVTGGYYDWKNSVPLGESGSRDTETYIGALNTLIDGLKSKYKDSAIVFVTPWNFTGTNDLSLTYGDYAEAAVAACEAKGVYCYKAHDSAISGVDMQNAEFRAEYALSADDSYHLNLDGMKLAMPKVETFLNECVTYWLETLDVDTDTKNEDEASDTTDTEDTTEEAKSEETAEEDGGCGSSVGLPAFALLACVALVAVLPLKKREQ